MITRPLDLASRLRAEPRNFDGLFYVNAGLLALFFSLFGSAFVLAPGLSVGFRFPVAAGAKANAMPTTHFISVLATGQIFTSQGPLKFEQLESWFAEQARSTKRPVLLVRGDALVPMSVAGAITGAATRAGFQDVTWAMVDAADSARSGGR
jgi:biopolymer transport protein ExbD